LLMKKRRRRRGTVRRGSWLEEAGVDHPPKGPEREAAKKKTSWRKPFGQGMSGKKQTPPPRGHACCPTKESDNKGQGREKSRKGILKENLKEWRGERPKEECAKRVSRTPACLNLPRLNRMRAEKQKEGKEKDNRVFWKKVEPPEVIRLVRPSGARRSYVLGRRRRSSEKRRRSPGGRIQVRRLPKRGLVNIGNEEMA